MSGITGARRRGSVLPPRWSDCWRHWAREVAEKTYEFTEFLVDVLARPNDIIRDIFQVFHDMVKSYAGQGLDEYPDDPESVGFYHYDCSKIFVEGADHPFFADRIFANRLMNMIDGLRGGSQQNKIYLFDGPPGCGKTTIGRTILRLATPTSGKILTAAIMLAVGLAITVALGRLGQKPTQARGQTP